MEEVNGDERLLLILEILCNLMPLLEKENREKMNRERSKKINKVRNFHLSPYEYFNDWMYRMI